MKLVNDTIELLQKNISPLSFESNRRQLVIRCPFCGDSLKANSHHLYIRITTYPMLYYCQICNTTGIVGGYLLNKLGVHDVEISSQLDHDTNKMFKDNRKFNSLDKRGFSFINNDHNLVIPTFNGSRNDTSKLQYLISRLGCKLKREDLSRFRIIFNLDEFLEANDIDNITVDGKLYGRLVKDYVGFLSTDDSCVMLRNIHSDKYRHFTYGIHNSSAMQSIFTISTRVDICRIRQKVVLAEGIMSLICGYYHIFNRDPSILFISCFGKGYAQAISHLHDSGFMDLDITILSDNDVDVKFYKRMVRNNPILNSDKEGSVTILYNEGADDFGVDKDKIKINKLVVQHGD